MEISIAGRSGKSPHAPRFTASSARWRTECANSSRPQRTRHRCSLRWKVGRCLDPGVSRHVARVWQPWKPGLGSVGSVSTASQCGFKDSSSTGRSTHSTKINRRLAGMWEAKRLLVFPLRFFRRPFPFQLELRFIHCRQGNWLERRARDRSPPRLL